MQKHRSSGFAARLMGFVASVVIGASAASAQATWFVSEGGGPGIDFTDIQSAVDAASPRDRVIVFAGSYPFFVVDKPVEILATQPFIELYVDVFNGPDAVRIENLAPGDVFVMHGFGPFSVFPIDNIEVVNCAGTVVLEQLVNAGINVTGSADVRIAESVLGRVVVSGGSRAVLENVSMPNLFNFAQLDVRNSEVLVSGCSIFGSIQMGLGQAGLSLMQGNVVAVDSTIGAGGSFPNTPAVVGTGTLTRSRTSLVAPSGFPTVEPGVTIVNRDIARLDATGAPPGGTVQVALKGTPSALYATLIGIPTPPVDIGFADPLWVLPILKGPSGSLDASGNASFSVPVPFDLGLLGLSICWQGATLSSSGFELTTPSTYVHTIF